MRLRERADTSRQGLGARLGLLAMSDEARAEYDLQFRQLFFYLTANGQSVRAKISKDLCFFLSYGIFGLSVADSNCIEGHRGFGRAFRCTLISVWRILSTILLFFSSREES